MVWLSRVLNIESFMLSQNGPVGGLVWVKKTPLDLRSKTKHFVLHPFLLPSSPSLVEEGPAADESSVNLNDDNSQVRVDTTDSEELRLWYFLQSVIDTFLHQHFRNLNTNKTFGSLPAISIKFVLIRRDRKCCYFPHQSYPGCVQFHRHLLEYYRPPSLSLQILLWQWLWNCRNRKF